MLRLDDHWVWDSWVADDGELFHLYFLKAPRSDDPTSRHARAVVGHATSADLVDWTLLPDALGPRAGAWDDLAIWTGSVLRTTDGWLMPYTAISRAGGLGDQRVGLATSGDLTTWRRVGAEPAVVADPRWYAVRDGRSETWRDPVVVADPDGDGWHLLLTARARDGEPGDDGVLGHARSRDLETWEVCPPLTSPGAGFGQLEVPQVRQVDGRWVLLLTCHPDEQSAGRRARWGAYCTWSVPGASALGPWDVASARPFEAVPDLFAAPLVQRRDGSWCLLGFRNRESEGVHAFEICDPVPVELDAEGYLVAVV